MKKFLRAIAILFLLTACSYDEYKMPKEVYINLNNKNINVYEKVTVNDLIKDTNVEIINSNKKITTDKIGNNIVIVKYKYKKRYYKYNANYNVIDNEKPIFINYSSVRTIPKGIDINFCDEISYADNYDREPSCKIGGEIDFMTSGTYNLKYVISDQSNNKNEENLKVNIVEAIENKTSSYESENKYFSDIINKYKNSKNMIGIDISAWQGEIDFDKIKKSGCEFVIIRMAFSSKINQDLTLDKYYKDNIKKAKNAGLKVGVYFYTNAASINEVKKQSKFILKNLKGIKLDLPIAYDFESWSTFNEFKLNTHDLDNLFNTFNDEMKKNGYEAMIYSSKYYLEKVWLNEKKNKIWLAHYTDYTNYDGDYILWQMSNTGRIDGIYGDVDIDIYYKK